MTTTTKTVRGRRAAIILCKKEDRLRSKYHPEEKRDLAKLVDAAVFPGLQGGPLEHIIAAKAIAFSQAMKPEFLEYQRQIVKNASALAESLISHGVRLVSGGTDNHLMLIDCSTLGITGKQGANRLADAGIYTNFNMIPFDERKPFDPSGIRLGTPALTTRGLKEDDMHVIGSSIAEILKNIDDTSVFKNAQKTVALLTQKYPLYDEL